MRSSKVLLLAAALLLATASAGAEAAAGAVPGERIAVAELPADASFEAMSWNIHFGVSPNRPEETNLDSIRDEIAAQDPDVIALQEIHREHEGDPANPEDPGDHGDQIVEMREKLRELGYVDFYGSPPGKRGNLIASKYDLTDKGYLDLPEDEHGKPGILLHATVARAGQDVRVYSTHLQNPDTDYHTDLRNKEVRYILERIGRLTEPVLLMGDFNLRADDPMKSVIGGHGFVDTWTTVRDSEDGVTTNGGHDENCHATVDKVKRIDYVFSSPAVVTESGTVACQTDASDHEPVIMRLKVEPRPIEAAGSVRAGELGLAGWAHLTVFTDRTSRLTVCDNKAGDWRVTARGFQPPGGATFVRGDDGGSDRGRCQTFTHQALADPTDVALETCVQNKDTGEVRDCRKRGLLER